MLIYGCGLREVVNAVEGVSTQRAYKEEVRV